MTNNLKLYVVGEHSGDPDNWSEWGARAIVVAHDPKEAASMVDFSYTATEISLDKPQVLMIETPHKD